MKFCLVLFSALTVNCAAQRPSSKPSGAPWTLTFGGSPCVLRGLGDQLTDGGCGARALVVTPALARSLGSQVAALPPETTPTAGGEPSLLSSGATTTRIDPAQADQVLAELRRQLDTTTVREREARLQLPACPAGQVVIAFDSCPDSPGNPLADVCGPATHTCGAPLAAGATCPANASCGSGRCTASGVCE